MSVRLLVVDDDAATLTALCDALRLNISDAAVSIARSGEDALLVLTTGRFDAVLSDVRMPGRSGMDLLREVKARYPDCPVFLMTGCEGKARPEAMSLGVAQFLEKPIDVKRLAFLLKQATDQAKLLKALRERNRQSHPE
jgi:DNA-binding NtrC family response regulator